MVTHDRPADAYEIDDDLARMDLDRVHRWLSTDAYWALGRSRATVETAAGSSLNLGAFAPGVGQVGYARVVTDAATFAWLCDVYVDPAHRGQRLGVRLVEAAVARLRPLGLSRVLLATRDAHGLYAALGFTPLAQPERLMSLGPTHPRGG